MQILNMEETIRDLRHGAEALVNPKKIFDLNDHNSKSMLIHEVGRFYTDQLVTMIKKGFVAGPFTPDQIPIPNLRINCLFAVNQSDKYRPILNLSKPDGNSFNGAIYPEKLRKVSMSTGKQVAETIYNVGKNAIISKIDHVSAYKLVPVRHEDFYLQGFNWLGRSFIETRLIFGSQQSVPKYDNLHNTVSDLTKVKSGTDRQNLERVLDDQINIAKSLDEAKLFIETYLDLAARINLPLAETTGSDKSFLYRTSGVVLGVYFNTVNMTWMYTSRKRLTHMKVIQNAIRAPNVTLNTLQKVAGVINTLVLLCPSLRFLRTSLINQLTEAYTFSPLPLSSETVKLLHIWLHIFHDLQYGFPIPKTMPEPPVTSLAFVSDAAGLPKHETKLSHDIGIGAVGYVLPFGEIFYAGQALWSLAFVKSYDSHLKLFGCKTTLLDAIGLIIPLYHNRQHLKGKHVVVFVDNLPTVWANKKGRSKTDDYSSAILTALNHVAVSWPFKLYVKHLPRVSSQPAWMADLLTRTDEKGLNVIKMWQSEIVTGWPPSLIKWMEKPNKSLSLGSDLLCDFQL